ncbi:MAG: hypothetical protein U0236_09755 [Nitrospira sp.]
MNRIVVGLIIIGIGQSSLSLTRGEEPPQQPSAQERLNQVLNSEGGKTVYMDAAGNVHTTTDLPNGDRTVIVQPPASPAMNLGPPLQLNNRPLQLPPPPPAPAHPPAPDFPQKAR